MVVETKYVEEAFKIYSKGGKWFGGEELGFLDIVMGSSLGWIHVIEKIFGMKILDGEKFPLLTDWDDRFCSEDAMKEVMPKTDKLVEFTRMLIARMKAASPAN